MCERIKGIFKKLLGKEIISPPQELDYLMEVDDQRAMLTSLEGGTDDSENPTNRLDIREKPITIFKA